jgi:hypothetical protein
VASFSLKRKWPLQRRTKLKRVRETGVLMTCFSQVGRGRDYLEHQERGGKDRRWMGGRKGLRREEGQTGREGRGDG